MKTKMNNKRGIHFKKLMTKFFTDIWTTSFQGMTLLDRRVDLLKIWHLGIKKQEEIVWQFIPNYHVDLREFYTEIILSIELNISIEWNKSNLHRIMA